MNVRDCGEPRQWDDMVREHGGHPLQLWGWGELKAAHNWRAHRLIVEDRGRVIGGAQVLQRRLPWPFRSLLYVPRGPVGDPTVVLPPLAAYVSAHFSATHLSIEPHREKPLRVRGWHRVAKAVLLPRTVILDLRQPEEALLAAMAKKTRQYIRKSANNGVGVRRATQADIAACLAIYRHTAERANFRLHTEEYYRDLHREMADASHIFVAEYEGRVVAFVWLVATPEIAFELYGGMDDVGQRLRANYTLKWQAIQAMQRAGVRQYDMNGLLNDGVSTFKQGFADHETQLIGTYDYPLSVWYRVWQTVFPALKRSAQTIASLRK